MSIINGRLYAATNGGLRYSDDGAATWNTAVEGVATSVKTEIRPNGEVYTYKDVAGEGEYCGTIPLVQFANPEGLEEVGKNRYRATEQSGEIVLIQDHNRIAQYGIERSNVDIFASVDEIMRLNTSLLASTSLMKAVGDMYDKAINIRD